MDGPEEEVVVNVDYTILHFIYGFLALLGICIVFSLAKAIYYYYKLKTEIIAETTAESIDTENDSVLSEPTEPEEQVENSVPDSDRLRVQLDKLRRLLNRLNAMGTFSRDTIGDLSAETATCGNISRATSSDMSALWSSIDFDEFEESTLHESNFRETQMEKSVSLSLSEFSMDTSGMHFDKSRQNDFASSSNKNGRNFPSSFSNRTNPSDAIVQILAILDSIVQKNRHDGRSLADNTLTIENTSNESINNRDSQSALSDESRVSPKPSSTVSIDKMKSKCKPLNSDTVNRAPLHEKLENQNIETKVIGNTSELLNEKSQVKEPQCTISSEDLMNIKVSKVTSVVNISPSYVSEISCSTKLSPKSLDAKNASVSQSVAVCIDPISPQSPPTEGNSEYVLSSSKESYLIQNSSKKLSDSYFSKISPCKFTKISHYHSSLVDMKSTTLTNPQCIEKSYSYKNKLDLSNFTHKNNTQIVVSSHDTNRSSEDYSPTRIEVLNKDVDKYITPSVNQRNFTSISCRNLQSPFADGVVLKTSISETEINFPPIFAMLSPNLSSSGSDAFLSPLIAVNLSPFEKCDWKSPVELQSDIFISHNLTPHNENTILPRQSRIWLTPPSPKDCVSNSMQQIKEI